jgi:hypothetical protein
MKLKLNKKKLKNLSNDNQKLPSNLTPQIAGGTIRQEKISRTCPSVCDFIAPPNESEVCFF